MSDSTNNEIFNRATGLLVIEVINSNPNGDPDKESDPRWRNDQRGEISPVSLKRKLRDLVEDKEGVVWKNISHKLGINDGFDILEKRDRDRKEIINLLENDKEAFKRKFWDGRVFGNTFLEEGSSTSVKTGVVQFGLGVSVSPIHIERLTTTNKSGVEEGKDRGMAPLSYRIVQHGIYCLPFFINPSVAFKTGCTKKDIDLLLGIIPHAYKHTASYIRSNVDFIHAWFIEHKTPLGSCSDFDLLDALTPKKPKDPDKPSTTRTDYYIPKKDEVFEELRKKVLSIRDLMEEI